MPKADETDIEIHELILAKNDLALARLFDIYGELVITSLKQWYPKIAVEDSSLIIAAVNEAFFGYYQNPKTFNPLLNGLKRFLEIASERDLLNLLQRERKHMVNRIPLPEDVELQEIFWNRYKRGMDNPESELIENEISTKVNSLLMEIFPEKKDRDFAKLILVKERKRDFFIELLDISALPKKEQEILVKRNKDRLKKVIERNDLENKIKALLI